MKIKDGLKLKGRPAEIPNVGRDDLPAFFKEMGFKVGAEIGVYQGEFSEKLAKDGLKLYCVDPWADYEDYHDSEMKDRMNKFHEITKERLAPYDCTIIRKFSEDASKDFEDESLDFVYIDGHHGFKYVTQDIWDWFPKVKKGGVMAGHDYIYTTKGPYQLHACHVKFVLPAITGALGIRNWYVLGERHGENRDPHRSWMFIKS